MNTLINLAVKFTGLGKLWDIFNGKKAYIGSAGLILLGAAKLLSVVAAVHSPAELFALLKTMSADTEAIKLISEGLLGLGLRHAVGKTQAQPAP